MEKTIVCTRCSKPFLVSGKIGSPVPKIHYVMCPYDKCGEINEVSWAEDGWCRAYPIPQPKSET